MIASPAVSEETLLRVLTCGSVDDGKSTLLGRLMYDCDLVPEDQLSALERDSRTHGTVPGGLDFSLLFDGLLAEREQGITIDVAYRYFATPRRKFIMIDSPGHVQYTRNMVTGASQAEIAVLLVDARKGLLEQTLRHSKVLALVGLRRVVLAVNKMDLVGFERQVFDAIHDAYAKVARTLEIELALAVPVAAVAGDNVAGRSARMPWYDGPSLLEFLETTAPRRLEDAGAFRMPVQYVTRPDVAFRGFAGRVTAGTAAPGDVVRAYPGGREARIARIATMDGDLDRAEAGRSVTLVLDDEIDVSRGHVLAAGPAPEVGDRFNANLVWFADAPLVAGRRYLLKVGSRSVVASVTALKHRLDVSTMEPVPAKSLSANDIGVCDMATEEPIVFEPFARGSALGAFLLIDRVTDETVGAGMIRHALRRGANVFRSEGTVLREERAAAKNQRGCVIWMTGLSGSGKSTIAHALERELTDMGAHAIVLDGDNLRHGLNKDLGFTEADRVENVRRVAEVARLMTDAGLIVIAALISPYRRDREAAREIAAPGEFLEVFVDTPLDECEKRDPKGLYKRARRGDIPNFTGVGAPYEPPANPELRLDTVSADVTRLAGTIVEALRRRNIVKLGNA